MRLFPKACNFESKILFISASFSVSFPKGSLEKLTSKVVPRPSPSLSTLILPPQIFMSLLIPISPLPVLVTPLPTFTSGIICACFSNLSRFSGAIPIPLSFTFILIYSWLSLIVTFIFVAPYLTAFQSNSSKIL